MPPHRLLQPEKRPSRRDRRQPLGEKDPARERGHHPRRPCPVAARRQGRHAKREQKRPVAIPRPGACLEIVHDRRSRRPFRTARRGPRPRERGRGNPGPDPLPRRRGSSTDPQSLSVAPEHRGRHRHERWHRELAGGINLRQSGPTAATVRGKVRGSRTPPSKTSRGMPVSFGGGNARHGAACPKRPDGLDDRGPRRKGVNAMPGDRALTRDGNRPRGGISGRLPAGRPGLLSRSRGAEHHRTALRARVRPDRGETPPGLGQSDAAKTLFRH